MTGKTKKLTSLTKKTSLITSDTIRIEIRKNDSDYLGTKSDHLIDIEVCNQKGQEYCVSKISDYRHAIAYTIAMLAEFEEAEGIEGVCNAISKAWNVKK